MGNVLTFSILPITMQKGIFRDVKDEGHDCVLMEQSSKLCPYREVISHISVALTLYRTDVLLFCISLNLHYLYIK